MEIGAWGDSITYGECDSEALGWVGRIRKSVSEEKDGGIYNRGICGDTSEDLLERFPVEAAAIEPELILFAIGINDSKIPAGKEENLIPLDTFSRNLSTLISYARTHTRNIILISLTNVDESALQSLSRFSNTEIERYNEALKAIAGEEKLPFVDVYGILEAADLYDGLHPNSQGYAKLAQVIEKALTNT